MVRGALNTTRRTKEKRLLQENNLNENCMSSPSIFIGIIPSMVPIIEISPTIFKRTLDDFGTTFNAKGLGVTLAMARLTRNVVK